MAIIMLNLTRKTDYALVALAYLGQQDAGSALSSRCIAEQFHLPLPLLMNILKELGQAGIVRATRGASGGYTLARPAHEVRLLEIIEAIEGPMRFAECTDRLPIVGQGCQIEGCPIRNPIRRLHDRLRSFLDHVTLEDLLDCQVDVALDQLHWPDRRPGHGPPGMRRHDSEHEEEHSTAAAVAADRLEGSA